MNTDNVNNPKHYNDHPSGVECIIITSLGKEKRGRPGVTAPLQLPQGSDVRATGGHDREPRTSSSTTDRRDQRRFTALFAGFFTFAALRDPTASFMARAWTAGRSWTAARPSRGPARGGRS